MTTANNKTVTVYRCASFLSESQKGMEHYMAASKQAVGGYWASTSSKAVGTGLTPTEQNILLPLVLDISPEDREFRKLVREFYEALETPIDYNTGRKLNIGLTNNDEDLSKDNLPEDPMDYIRYRHILRHPEVAESKELADGNQLIRFYIHNPNKVKASSNKLREARETAMQKYLSVTKEDEKVDNILALYGEDPRAYEDGEAKRIFIERKTQSDKIADLEKFCEIVDDKQLEVKGFINKLVRTGILQLVGTRYMISETKAILADNIDGAVIELSDEETNSGMINSFKAQLQEKMKLKIKSLLKNRR